MSFKCNLSFLETVLRGSLRAEQCWYSPWFVSLSKHLKAVNKGKLPTCCTLSTVKRKEHILGKAIPVDSGQKQLTQRTGF